MYNCTHTIPITHIYTLTAYGQIIQTDVCIRTAALIIMSLCSVAYMTSEGSGGMEVSGGLLRDMSRSWSASSCVDESSDVVSRGGAGARPTQGRK